jgi:hypothetical protein
MPNDDFISAPIAWLPVQNKSSSSPQRHPPQTQRPSLRTTPSLHHAGGQPRPARGPPPACRPTPARRPPPHRALLQAAMSPRSEAGSSR